MNQSATTTGAKEINKTDPIRKFWLGFEHKETAGRLKEKWSILKLPAMSDIIFKSYGKFLFQVTSFLKN